MSSNKSKRYTEEFKSEAIKLVQSGQSVPDVAKQLNMSKNTLYTWMANENQEQTEMSDEELSALQQENKQLKKELKQLKEEHTILKKACAYFARETA